MGFSVMFKHIKQKTYKLALEIKNQDTVYNNRKPPEQFTAKIEDKEISMSSKAWGEFKTLTEYNDCGRSVVALRVNGKRIKEGVGCGNGGGWEVQHAIDCPVGIKYKDYLRSIGEGGKQLEKENAVKRGFNIFLGQRFAS